MTILETDRLLLRRLRIEDLEPLYALYRDPEVRRYFPEGTLDYDQTREELVWFLDGHPDRPELGLWATILKETGAFIGRCGLLPWTIEDRAEVEVAYLLARDHWGRGLGTEAARALAGYAFEGLGLPRVVSLIEPGNTASVRVARKIGMILEGRMQDEHGPFLLYAMNRSGSSPETDR